MRALREGLGATFAWFGSLALTASLLTVPEIAVADEFEIEPGPPTLTPITLSKNDGEIFDGVQPEWTSSSDRYNVETTIGLPGGHDDLEKMTMCWYLLDFQDCFDQSKIDSEPEIVFKATYATTRDGTEVTSESFRVVGDNNYDVSQASTNILEASIEAVNVLVSFSFTASNAMRSSSNWKIYLEVEDNRANTAAVSRDGVRVKYFSQMTTDRPTVNFGGVVKGGTSVENDIDSGLYTANAESRFFIEATDFVNSDAGARIDLFESGTQLVNQVQVKCERDSSFDSSSAQLVTTVASQFGGSLSPSSEDPEDPSNHSCAVVFPEGGATDPNLQYSNTFILSIGASPTTAPQNILATTEGVSDDRTEVRLTFDPPQIIQDGNASLDSYRVRAVDVSSNTSREVGTISIQELEGGSWGYTDSSSRLEVTVAGLTPDTLYEFEVEANTSLGSGAATTSNRVSTAVDQSVDPGSLNVLAWETFAIEPTSVTAQGATGEITWAISEGILPAGLTLNSATGSISGTPTEAGESSVLVTFTDENSRQASQRVVFDINEEPTITPASFTVQGTVDEAVATTLPTLRGFNTAVGWSVQSGTLPNGLSLDTETGQITGTPTQSGATSVTLQFEDDEGLIKTQAVSFSIGTTNLYEFDLARFTPGGNIGHLGPTLSEIRTGISGNTGWKNNTSNLNSSNGIITWRVPEDGTYRIKAAGAGSVVTGGANGQGAVMEAWFDFQQGDELFLLVGQQNDPNEVAWAGGGGGSFVAEGDSIGTANPLLVAGGAGASRSRGFFSSLLRGSTSTAGKDGSGGRSGGINGGAANGSAVGITGTGHNSGGFGSAAGFYESGRASGDRRGLNGNTNIGPKSFRDGGVGGQFFTRYVERFYDGDTPNIHGGFGGGGAGGWGGSGGGGGYSGGGDDPNGGFAGGGGSFVAAEARNVSTSDGNFTDAGTHPDDTAYSGSVGLLGEWQNGNGYIEIELLD